MDYRSLLSPQPWNPPAGALVDQWPPPMPPHQRPARPTPLLPADMQQEQPQARVQPPIEEVFPSMAQTTPDDFKSLQRQMIMDNARRQYEQRFGVSPGAGRHQSMGAAGEDFKREELMRRLGQYRMDQMRSKRGM
jgi:hypothetical protein